MRSERWCGMGARAGRRAREDQVEGESPEVCTDGPELLRLSASFLYAHPPLPPTPPSSWPSSEALGVANPLPAAASIIVGEISVVRLRVRPLRPTTISSCRLIMALAAACLCRATCAGHWHLPLTGCGRARLGGICRRAKTLPMQEGGREAVHGQHRGCVFQRRAMMLLLPLHPHRARPMLTRALLPPDSTQLVLEGDRVPTCWADRLDTQDFHLPVQTLQVEAVAAASLCRNGVLVFLQEVLQADRAQRRALVSHPASCSPTCSARTVAPAAHSTTWSSAVARH